MSAFAVMTSYHSRAIRHLRNGINGLLLAVFSLSIDGCDHRTTVSTTPNTEINSSPSTSRENKVHPPNELGYAKVSSREADVYFEGIVDAAGKVVVEPSSSLLVNDITGKLALVQVGRKFLFVPLDQGLVTSADLDSVSGFQYAEPYQCGLALVKIDDDWFYINVEGEWVFEKKFSFAESFHHDRAFVTVDGHYRIIDTQGETVAELDFDQVNPQSPWCWQVTKVDQGIYRSGFIDLNGNLISELNYEYVGYYDSSVKRIHVCRNKRHGFLDELAREAVPLIYDDVEVFERGKARVTLNGRNFFINADGVEVPE